MPEYEYDWAFVDLIMPDGEIIPLKLPYEWALFHSKQPGGLEKELFAVIDRAYQIDKAKDEARIKCFRGME